MEEYIKISQMVHSITKMDVTLNDRDGNTLFDSIHHSIPVVLGHPDDEYVHTNEILNKHHSNQYYHHINPYGLEYMAVGIWREHSFYGSLIIGPFISSILVIDLIKEIMIKNSLPIGERKQLEQFYQSLPVLSEIESKYIGELLVNLCSHEYINSGQISSNTIKPVINYDQLKITIEENKDIIENRYHHQNKLMDAITKGDRAEVQILIDSLIDVFVGFSDRVPGNPIRSSKNMAFVCNTLYRVAAERSGVHPVYLHNISERFAIVIERTTTIPSLKKLMFSMANEYCDLVKSFSTGHYSPIVKTAVDYILLNLGYPISLTTIAKQIHVNPSHLSRKFKEDTGMNITDFINQKRVGEAKLYLQRGNISMTDIAFMVGFNDLNYFSKVFKKLTSVTPSQYAKKRKL
ncbi:AraC family transcriptional regulator [Neobacillus niacini]|uniref:AraC family transcriptional regulator n=1 Tax=Neobacillus niacini TaxID=86668 RepID=UPI002FFD82DB